MTKNTKVSLTESCWNILKGWVAPNIKYEIKESKIERGISKIDIVTKLGSWANSSYRAANRWARDDISIENVERWERIPWMEQELR